MLNFEDFKESFGEWAELFKPFIEGEEMFKIYQKLKEDGKKEIITPSSSDTFKSFKTSIPKEVKVIIFTGEPYSKRYKNKELQATGIGLDCSTSPDQEILDPLLNFYKGIESSLKIKIKKNKSLDHLQDQGIMLINSDLTCKLNKPGSHSGLWEPFQRFFLEEIMFNNFTNIVYVLMGKESEKLEKYINPLGNYIFKCELPIMETLKHRNWEHKDIFKKINHIFENNSNYPIEWDRELYYKYVKPPF